MKLASHCLLLLLVLVLVVWCWWSGVGGLVLVAKFLLVLVERWNLRARHWVYQEHQCRAVRDLNCWVGPKLVRPLVWGQMGEGRGWNSSTGLKCVGVQV